MSCFGWLCCFCGGRSASVANTSDDGQTPTETRIVVRREKPESFPDETEVTEDQSFFIAFTFVDHIFADQSYQFARDDLVCAARDQIATRNQIARAHLRLLFRGQMLDDDTFLSLLKDEDPSKRPRIDVHIPLSIRRQFFGEPRAPTPR
jgi:hypothetical protein